MYLDANNLYGWAMSQPIPTGEFAWLTENEIQRLSIENIPDDSDDGYISEVDLSYPAGLHDQHNDYPLAPEIDSYSWYALTLLLRFSYRFETQDHMYDQISSQSPW